MDEAALRAGMAGARWPGRLELFRRPPAAATSSLDGAHNPAGARALARALAELGVERFPLVFGAMRGKRVTAVLRALAPLEPRPVFTAVTDPTPMPARGAAADLAPGRFRLPAERRPGRLSRHRSTP